MAEATKKTPAHPLAAKAAGDTTEAAPDPQPTPEEVEAQEKAAAEEKRREEQAAAAQTRDDKLNEQERDALDAAADEADGVEEPTEPTVAGWYATDDEDRPAHMIFLLDGKGNWYSVTSGLHTELVQPWYVLSGGAVKLLVPLLSPAAQALADEAAAAAESESTDWA